MKFKYILLIFIDVIEKKMMYFWFYFVFVCTSGRLIPSVLVDIFVM